MRLFKKKMEVDDLVEKTENVKSLSSKIEKMLVLGMVAGVVGAGLTATSLSPIYSQVASGASVSLFVTGVAAIGNVHGIVFDTVSKVKKPLYEGINKLLEASTQYIEKRMIKKFEILEEQMNSQVEKLKAKAIKKEASLEAKARKVEMSAAKKAETIRKREIFLEERAYVKAAVLREKENQLEIERKKKIKKTPVNPKIEPMTEIQGYEAVIMARLELKAKLAKEAEKTSSRHIIKP